MTLSRLQVRDFRCIAHADLELDPACTVLVGPNGSGKTSFLEAIHVLSCGRSFRTHQLGVLVRKCATDFMAVGFLRSSAREIVLGVQYSEEGLQARIAGQRARGFAELASLLPVQIIDPNVHSLVEAGPENRRTFLDRGLFHVEPHFVQVWRRYQRALKQRNRALKLASDASLIRTWDDELVQNGTSLAADRERYIQELTAIIEPFAMNFFSQAIELRYSRGWAADMTLEAALERAWSRDQQTATTTVGPHRADLIVTLSGRPAKQSVSRGQQKMLAAALILAQLTHFTSRQLDPGCLLLDDPAAELDVDNLSRLLAHIEKIRAQLIVTSLKEDQLTERLSARVFHVKQGQIA